jgi:glycosyltransferase involved in cell wall biosynthesis
MGAGPLVSVMMPCYNVASTLPMAVASLFAQSYSNWEAVVVDDGSSDRTWELLCGLSDDRLRLHRFEQNRGRGAARQQCLEMARGELLAFLDADDWLFPDKLAKQVSLMESHPDIAVLSACCVITDAEGNAVGVTRTGIEPGSSLTRGRMAYPGPPPLSFPPCMIRMSALGDARFNPELRRSQDSDFLIQVMLGKQYAVSSDLLYAYSQAEAANLQKTLEGYRYRVRCYRQYTRSHPLRSRAEIAKTAVRMGIYTVAGWLRAERHLISRRWRPITPDAEAAYAQAKAEVMRVLARNEAA